MTFCGFFSSFDKIHFLFRKLASTPHRFRYFLLVLKWLSFTSKKDNRLVSLLFFYNLLLGAKCIDGNYISLCRISMPSSNLVLLLISFSFIETCSCPNDRPISERKALTIRSLVDAACSLDILPADSCTQFISIDGTTDRFPSSIAICLLRIKDH